MTRSQVPVIKDGVSLDMMETAKRATERVDRSKDKIPIHACGKVSSRECPCWICTKNNCAACVASLL